MADHNPDEYKNIRFYEEHSKAKQAGFSKFKVEKDFYFCRYIDGDIAMLSQAYTSEAGRDNGIESVKKNEKQAKRYKFLSHGKGQYGFSLKAGNGQEIAISPNYTSHARAEHVSGRLSGRAKAKTGTPKKSAPKKVAPAKVVSKTSVSKPRAAIVEQNYMPLAFYKKATKGKKTGFESFKGDDGEHYFTYFENEKIALISEGYPTAAVRDKGLASVQKNMKTESRYVYGKGDDGKEGFALRAGNNKEIARSVGYGSAAAAVTGAAYLMGKRRRVSPKPTAVTKPRVVKKAAAAKPRTVKKKTKPSIAPLAVGSVAAAGLAAGAAAAKTNAVKKAAVPVKAAPKPKPVKQKAKRTITPLAAGSVAVAGLAASAAAAKTSAVKKASVPIKAAPIKDASTAAPIKAAPIAAAALGTAAVAAAAAVAAKPKAKPIAAAPVAAAVAAAPVAAAIPAAASAGGGAGIWGWLKWVLMGLIALFAILFLWKSCVGGEKVVKATPVATTTKTAAPAAMVTCWNGSKAKTDQACPTKITCWDDSFATQQSACPVKTVVKEFVCWDGSMAIGESSCPVEPAATKTPAGTTIGNTSPKTSVANATSRNITSPSVEGRVCAPSSNVLFNVTTSTPKSVSYLGSNPQFGESLSLTPDGFYRKLATAYRTNPSDKAFLNLVARSLGYGSFRDMDASMFSNDTLANGTSGLLGFGSQHALQYSSLNVTDVTNLEAFKVRSANGTDVHFMKRCGNFMYVCQP